MYYTNTTKEEVIGTAVGTTIGLGIWVWIMTLLPSKVRNIIIAINVIAIVLSAIAGAIMYFTSRK